MSAVHERDLSTLAGRLGAALDAEGLKPTGLETKLVKAGKLSGRGAISRHAEALGVAPRRRSRAAAS